MAAWSSSGYGTGYGDQIGSLPNINDTIICPYNTSHVVGVSRMQRHLYNCRKNNPAKAALISFCPYNQSHHILTADMSAHLVVCRDYLAHKFQTLMRRDLTRRIEEADQKIEKKKEEEDIIPLLPQSEPLPWVAQAWSGGLECNTQPGVDYGSRDLPQMDYDVMSLRSSQDGDFETSSSLRSATMTPFSSACPSPAPGFYDDFFDNPPEIPTHPRHVTKTCIMKEVIRDGEIWTTFEGEGHPLAHAQDFAEGQARVAAAAAAAIPRPAIPPCDQEEIDNWNC